MKKNVLIILSVFGLVFGTQAQDSELPPMVAGKCYAKCYIPDVWETNTEQVLVKEASTSIRTTPPTYRTETEQVLTKEASKRLVAVPAEYEYVTETKKVKEENVVWVRKRDRNCQSADPRDCMILCAETEPARYETYKRRVVKTPATTREVEIPAEYKTITKKLVDKPAGSEVVDIPAEYKTVTNRVLVKKGGYTEWREVVCGGGTDRGLMTRVQKALRDKGYDIGPSGIDGIMGSDTRAALLKFQSDNSLPQGQLDLKTLEALGVN